MANATLRSSVVYVGVFHHIEVQFTGHDKRFVLGGFAGEFGRKWKLGLFWREETLLTSLEAGEFGAESLNFLIGVMRIGIVAELSEFLSKGLEFNAEGGDCCSSSSSSRGQGRAYTSHC
jgi:hypothetical protein